MVYRNSWLAGLAALAFAFLQLNNLVLPTADGVPWQYIVIAALALGVIITWTALTYRLKTWIVLLVNAAAALIAVVRVSTPETTAFFLPTRESLTELGARLDAAQELIRTGVEPVVPDAGVVVVMMIVLWAVGGLLSWGLMRDHPYVALLPPVVLSLQFATMNRIPTGAFTVAAFIGIIALVVFAVTSDERAQTSGRMAPRGGWAGPRARAGPAAAALLGVTVLGSVFVVGAVDDTVPDDGLLDWRVDSGLPSDSFGSVSYNPFIGIQQRLVNNSNTTVFLASIASDVPPDEVYFRFMTLANYDGRQFSVGGSREPRRIDDDVWQDPGHAFAGPTEDLATIVVIDRLKQEYLPTPAVPVAVEPRSGRFGPYLQVRPEDAAIYYPNRTSFGMEYRVDAKIPRPDVAVLATDQTTGELSPAFQAALEDAELPDDLVPGPVVVAETRPKPPDAQRFLDLPWDDADARMREIQDLAQQTTRGLATAFEKGIALEAFLRTFTYEANIQPGHAASDLADWLLDPLSPNHQTGYCENFSTAMAVMARTLGIHSRVVLGFTPGERSLVEPGTVIVRDKNAHAWVELWIPSQGWVRFDPTPRPDRVNPSTAGLTEAGLDFALTSYLDVELPEPGTPGSPSLPIFEGPPVSIFVNPLGDGDLDPASPRGPAFPNWAPPAGLALLVLVLVILAMPAVKLVRHRRRLRRLQRGDITAAWEDIVARLGDLGRPVAANRTPAEAAAEVDESMRPLADVYGRALYGPPRGDVAEEDIAVAQRSLLETRAHLASATPRRGRLLAWYRMAIPGRRRNRNGRRDS